MLGDWYRCHTEGNAGQQKQPTGERMYLRGKYLIIFSYANGYIEMIGLVEAQVYVFLVQSTHWNKGELTIFL